jgi:methionyl-tRNA synthetase
MPEFPNDDPALVTCALPYANGKAHLGHLRTYIPGDAFTRALRTLGQDVTFVCGSDMHGTPIVVNAEEQGREPEELAMEYHRYFEETFPRIDVDFDHYGHTHQRSNVERTQAIVRALEENGHVYEDAMMVAYDPEADRTLPDRYVQGICPHCGNEEARGDECDECGRHLEPGDVQDPVSTLTGAPAEYVEQEHRFFALSDFKDELSDFVAEIEGTSNAKNQPVQWIEEGLQDWCITRDLDWGVPYPDDGGADGEGEDGDDEGSLDLVLYVWVDAPCEYIASTEEWARDRGDPDAWQDYWLDDDSSIVHVIGGDIIQHHCVFWPAMLMGADYATPDAVMASGLVKVNDRAFSTSKGRAVWLDEDYLDEELNTDFIRYYITSYTGYEKDLNFSWELFRERVNNELVDTLGNFTYRSLLLAGDHFDGVPGGPAGGDLGADGGMSDDIADAIERATEAFHDAIDDYDIKGAVEAAMALAGDGNEYIQQEEPWHLVDEDPDAAVQVLHDCVRLCKALAVLIEPVMPAAAEDLWVQLDEPGSVHDATLDDCTAPLSDGLGEPEHLFEQLDDATVERLDARLQERVSDGDGDAADDDGSDAGDDTDATDTDDAMTELEPIANTEVSFDDFQDLDIRVAEIVAAEPIEDSDDLVLLDVDVGHETRQVVAGIKQLHDVDALPGTRVIVVVNLETAEIFGHASEAMLLAAGEDADLLTTHGDSPVGTRIQ